MGYDNPLQNEYEGYARSNNTMRETPEVLPSMTIAELEHYQATGELPDAAAQPRAEWRVQDAADHVSVVCDSQQVCVMVRFPDDQRRQNAAMIVRDHNQRDEIIRLARLVVKKYEGNFAVPFEDAEMLDLAQRILGK